MCEAACCASLPSEKRFGGLPQEGVGSQAAQHGTAPPYRATGHQRGLHAVSVSRSAGREGALQGKWLHLASLDREGMMCGSIWGTTGFISLKEICAFKHQ